jgi:Uma2 family endonuclease
VGWSRKEARMALPRRTGITPEEYLEQERKAETKSEYYAGQVYVFAGASERHNLIVGNTFAALHAQLRRRPCKAYPSDMRVKVSSAGLYTYPDVVVVCGRAEFEDEENDTLLNPTVIIEVLSKTTEAYDRGRKFEQYRRLPSLADYLLIAQDQAKIEHYTRQSENEWLLSETRGPHDSIQIASIQCTLALDEVYEKVEEAGAE